MVDSGKDISGQQQPLQRGVVTPPPVARGLRRTMEPGAPITPVPDPFGMPPKEHADEPQPMHGAEPAIFGGLNPPVLPGMPTTTPAEEVPTPPADAADEEEVARPLLPTDTADLRRAVRSVPVLLVMMVLSILMLSWTVGRFIPLRNYAEVGIELAGFANLDSEEADEVQDEINHLLGLYPLRSAAMAHLAKSHASLSPGFLSKGALFQRAQ